MTITKTALAAAILAVMAVSAQAQQGPTRQIQVLPAPVKQAAAPAVATPAPAKVDGDLAAWVEGKLAERLEARRARDFARADALRKEVEARGVEIEDTPQGPKWRLR